MAQMYPAGAECIHVEAICMYGALCAGVGYVSWPLPMITMLAVCWVQGLGLHRPRSTPYTHLYIYIYYTYVYTNFYIHGGGG